VRSSSAHQHTPRGGISSRSSRGHAREPTAHTRW
jgi:hypothetical protein